MAIKPDQTEQQAAVAEAARIIESHKKFGKIGRLYDRYRDPVNYATTLIVTGTLLVGTTALMQEGQAKIVSAISENLAREIAKYHSTNLSLSAIGSLYVGNFLYEKLFNRRVTS